jgi:hypothetical protein
VVCKAELQSAATAAWEGREFPGRPPQLGGATHGSIPPPLGLVAGSSSTLGPRKPEGLICCMTRQRCVLQVVRTIDTRAGPLVEQQLVFLSGSSAGELRTCGIACCKACYAGQAPCCGAPPSWHRQLTRQLEPRGDHYAGRLAYSPWLVGTLWCRMDRAGFPLEEGAVWLAVDRGGQQCLTMPAGPAS